METPAERSGIEAYLIGLLERYERLSYYARSRGWGFILTWAHRAAGLLLVLYMFFHIYTLSGLHAPESFASRVALFDNFFFVFLEWALAIPVIFHGLNGTRLILYEVFRIRNDGLMIRWVFLLSALYLFSLGLFMLMGNQQVSAAAFWLTVATASTIAAGIVYRRLQPTQNAILWKLQRLSGAFLLPMVAGHMLFMHLSYRVGHDAGTIIARMSSLGMKFIDCVFVVTVFFHAGFGLCAIINDYMEGSRLRTTLSILASFVMAVFAYAGVKLVLTI